MSGSALRVIILSCLLALSGAAVYVIGGHTAWFLLGSCLSLFIYTLFVIYGLSGNYEVRQICNQEMLYAGDDTPVELVIKLPFSYPLAWVIVEERWANRSGLDELIERKLLLPNGKRTVSFRYTLKDLPRGIYQYRGCSLRIGDLFQAAARTIHLPTDTSQERVITILPKPLSGVWYEGLTSTYGSNGDYYASRDYMQGDPLRSIDWKSYARDRVWRTKQADKNDSFSLHICIDDNDRSSKSFERNLAAAARIIEVEARSFNLLELRCGEATKRITTLGRSAITLAMLWLTGLERRQGDSLRKSLNEMVMKAERGARFIVVTSRLNEQLLLSLSEQRRLRHSGLEWVYVSMNPSLTMEERKIIHSYNQAGWRVYPAPNSMDFKSSDAGD
jgi:uncharacterized protein (DUF58 family)